MALTAVVDEHEAHALHRQQVVGVGEPAWRRREHADRTTVAGARGEEMHARSEGPSRASS